MEDIEELIVSNALLIYKIANMFKNSGNDMDDLKQVGRIGFINAYKNFDPHREVKFTTYAYPYIYGEISKYVRENRGIKISRELTKLYYKIDKTMELLTQQLNKVPTVNEVASFLGISSDVVAEAIVSKNRIKSIDDSVAPFDNELSLHEVIGEKSKDIDILLTLRSALNKLSPIEYELVKDRYINDLTQSEIAEALNTSQVQVSRQEQKVLKKLKTYMTN